MLVGEGTNSWWGAAPRAGSRAGNCVPAQAPSPGCGSASPWRGRRLPWVWSGVQLTQGSGRGAGTCLRSSLSTCGTLLPCYPCASPFLGRMSSVQPSCQSLRKPLLVFTSASKCPLKKKKKSSLECIYLEDLWKFEALTKLVLLVLLANRKKWGYVMNVVFLMVI